MNCPRGWILFAGHAHAGVLTLMSLLYYTFWDQTFIPLPRKHAACAAVVIGILAESGDFFIHLSPERAQWECQS
jgi:hypothetical protein